MAAWAPAVPATAGQDMDDYSSLSLWLDDVSDRLVPRAALPGSLDVDVAIIGAGFTGLWTAYYLMKADPHLRVAVIEQETAGFGASGRNGGWVSPAFSIPTAAIAKKHGRASALGMQKAMLATVDEVGRVAAEEAIDAQYAKGGYLCASTSASQTQRLRRSLREQRAWGMSADDYVWLDAHQAAGVIRIAGCLGAMYTPHYACVQPAHLARGLAEVVERLGGRIYERTRALALRSGSVTTTQGRVRAGVVVRATEAYTVDLPGQRRAIMPLYSHMVATAPLSTAFWEEVGWRQREVFNDGRHLIVYAMRTRDDRIAIGGTRAPYHYGSRIAARFDRDDRVYAALRGALVGLFPGAGDVPITHRWGGPLAATRDWHAAVHFDRVTGLAWAGGYVGDGVATANLAGRTLADLILQRDTDLVALPWVNHRSRAWEPEPLRWLAATTVEGLLGRADKAESARDRPWRWAPVVERFEEIIRW